MSHIRDNVDAITFDVIVELIGMEDAIKLSMARGGRDLYVPTPDRTGVNSPAVVIMGVEATRKLGARFGGFRIRVPNGPGKRALVRKLRGEGKSIPEIIAATKYTERYVYLLLAQDPPALPAPPELPLLAFMSKP